MVFEKGTNSQQIEYFRRRLGAWRDQLVTESGETTRQLSKDNSFNLLRQAANRNASFQSPQEGKQKLIHKIDKTLYQIEAELYRMRNP
jgi:RNA polymerase-binding transcription factor DksA